MKRHAADQHYVIKLKERAVKVNTDPPAGFSDVHQLHQVARIVIQRLYSLSDEGSQYLLFFGVRRRAMNAGGEDDGHLVRRGAVRDQAPNEEVYDLAGAGLTCCIGNDEQNRFPGLHDVFQTFGINGGVEPFAYLNVSKGFLRSLWGEYFEAVFVVFERDGSASIPELNKRHIKAISWPSYASQFSSRVRSSSFRYRRCRRLRLRVRAFPFGWSDDRYRMSNGAVRARFLKARRVAPTRCALCARTMPPFRMRSSRHADRARPPRPLFRE